MLSRSEKFLGEELAFELLIDDLEIRSCSACGEKLDFGSCRFAVSYGKPVVVCDVECYEMLLANWKEVRHLV